MWEAHPVSVADPDLPGAEGIGLLTAGDVRTLAQRLNLHPTKTLGQNFVIDGGTIRRIVRLAEIDAGSTVLEIGPGLGSLTLGLLDTGAHVVAVEIDARLAAALPGTVAAVAPGAAPRLRVVHADAMTITEEIGTPTTLVANLPYNVSVPVLLHALARLESLTSALVMVQAEVGARLAAAPGSRTYGVPSAKVAWYAQARRAGGVSRTVFWPIPNVDSALVAVQRRDPPRTSATREQVFAVIDAAFAQRRKTLRAALTPWAGSADAAQAALQAAGVDPTLRGERLGIDEFAAIAEHQVRS
ncbi:MAG: 16S rRNA (adenine(1518)-N(6)/adenine(1519)-N(6))-dimethyltransferase RsmA [Beutenbergiaceae bacterium]